MRFGKGLGDDFSSFVTGKTGGNRPNCRRALRSVATPTLDPSPQGGRGAERSPRLQSGATRPQSGAPAAGRASAREGGSGDTAVCPCQTRAKAPAWNQHSAQLGTIQGPAWGHHETGDAPWTSP